MLIEVLGFVQVLSTGLLAGEEFVIRYGVRGPVAGLPAQPQIQLRQALIFKLRVVVPSVFGVAFISRIAVTLLQRSGPGWDIVVPDCAA
jgi:hypothetical protein